jgi:uncharacterized protein YbjT (DUF2867 family)
MPPSVLHVGVTGASGRLGTLLLQQLGTESAPLPRPGQAEPAEVAVTVLVPFTFNIADYQPWAGSAGAEEQGDNPFAGAVSADGEAAAVQEAIATAVSGGKATARLTREPRLLDLADTEAMSGAFAGLDIVVHLAATIHADADWPTVSRNNIDVRHATPRH